MGGSCPEVPNNVQRGLATAGGQEPMGERSLKGGVREWSDLSGILTQGVRLGERLDNIRKKDSSILDLKE